MPSRSPDVTVEIGTALNQALLYRFAGDLNPLHADPVEASRVGFDRPILHGMCTYAISCRAVLAAFCNYDPLLLRHFGARFSANVYPGETIRVTLWRDGSTVSFEAYVETRRAKVISNGVAILQ